MPQRNTDANEMNSVGTLQDLTHRLCELEAHVTQLSENRRRRAPRGWRSARGGFVLIAVAALLIVFGGGSVVVAETGFQGLFVDRSGNVGIGTTEPGNDKLRVNGSVSVSGPLKIGAEIALAAPEALRLVRGAVASNSVFVNQPKERPGYRVVRVLPGGSIGSCPPTSLYYEVTFTKPFVGMPLAFAAIASEGNAAPPQSQTAVVQSLSPEKMLIRVSDANTSGCTSPAFWFMIVGPA